jgi:hypothetical protein
LPQGILMLGTSRTASINLLNAQHQPLVIDAEFYGRGLPVVHGCVIRAAEQYFARNPRALSSSARTAWRRRTVGGTHMGSFTPREIHDESEDTHAASLHSFGRAIDLRTFTVGGVTFDYASENPRGGAASRTPSTVARWEGFWQPFVTCLNEGGLEALTDSENDLHHTHMHVSLPFNEDERERLGCARI